MDETESPFEEGDIFSDDKDVLKNSYANQILSKSNDGYRDGLSAGQLEGFVDEFKIGFHSSFPVLVKLFQLSKLLSRCFGYYKGIVIPEKDRQNLSLLHKGTGLVIKVVIKNFISITKTKDGDILTNQSPLVNLSVSSLMSYHKLHDGHVASSWPNLLEDLTLIYEFLDNYRLCECFGGSNIDELLFHMKEIVSC